jgi:hypothetical protein
LQDFLAGGALSCYRPQTVGYRLFLQIPPAYRLLGNLLFSRSYSWVMVAAVDAGGILASFTDAL